jgi:hypothetical protein
MMNNGVASLECLCRALEAAARAGVPDELFDAHVVKVAAEIQAAGRDPVAVAMLVAAFLCFVLARPTDRPVRR